MSHKIKVDVKSAIEDFYPRLTVEQVNYMADIIHARFDYSSIYDTIHDEITEIAYRKGIDLEDKDEPQIPPDLRLVQ
jgi:phage baseplate assembly protein W